MTWTGILTFWRPGYSEERKHQSIPFSRFWDVSKMGATKSVGQPVVMPIILLGCNTVTLPTAIRSMWGACESRQLCFHTAAKFMLSEGPHDIEIQSLRTLLEQSIFREVQQTPATPYFWNYGAELSIPDWLSKLRLHTSKEKWQFSDLCSCRRCWRERINSHISGLGILKHQLHWWSPHVYGAKQEPCLEYGHGSSHHVRVKY